MKLERQTAFGRRNFLFALGVGTAASAASAVPLATEGRSDSETPDEKRRPRYRETSHVKTFYSVNRYPAK